MRIRHRFAGDVFLMIQYGAKAAINSNVLNSKERNVTVRLKTTVLTLTRAS